MHGKHHLSDKQIAEIKRRRPAVRASLACEGMYLTAQEEALFEQMDAERLSPDERSRRIIEFIDANESPKVETAF